MGLLDLFTGDNKNDISDDELYVSLFDDEKKEVDKGDWLSTDFDDEDEDEDDYYHDDEFAIKILL